MARPSDLTQDAVNDAADQLRAQGKKPSPNAVRDILRTGSFSTIKQMLDVWADQQEQEANIPVPDMPDFAYRLLEKLHRELYMQNHKALEGDRQVLEATRQEFEAERTEMLGEIDTLEKRASDLEKSIATVKADLATAHSKLAETEGKLKDSITKSTTQQIEIATLSEREKQLKDSIKEKDSLLKQADNREAALQATIAKLSKSTG